MIRLALAAALLPALIAPANTHENPQTRLIEHDKQARCIVRGSEVHKVYQSMLVYLQRDLQEWNKLKNWVDKEMPLISASIKVHRSQSMANLNELEGVPVCPADS